MEVAQNGLRDPPQPLQGPTMITPNPIDSGKRSFRSRFLNRSTVLAFAAGAAVAAAIGGWHHGSMMDGTHSAAEVNAHVDHMLKHFYVEIDATEAQKAQIAPLVKQAVTDLLPLHTQAHAAHQHALDALSQATLDRSALEAARVEH